MCHLLSNGKISGNLFLLSVDITRHGNEWSEERQLFFRFLPLEYGSKISFNQTLIHNIGHSHSDLTWLSITCTCFPPSSGRDHQRHLTVADVRSTSSTVNEKITHLIIRIVVHLSISVQGIRRWPMHCTFCMNTLISVRRRNHSKRIISSTIERMSTTIRLHRKTITSQRTDSLIEFFYLSVSVV